VCDSHSVGGWVDGDLLDTADSLSGGLHGDLDVSSISPAGSPGVSDDVSIGVVSDGGDGVIELGSALSRVEDSTGVSLEDRSVGLDGDGNWSLGNGGHEGGGRSSLDVVLRSDHTDLSGVGGGSARSVSGGVLVVRLEGEVVGGRVSHGEVLPSTIASVAGGVAINELLLGEGEEVGVLDGVVSLKGSNGGESPA